MNHLYFCYEHDDSSEVVGRLYERLAEHLGPRNVFKDVWSMDLGCDYKNAIDAALAKSDVVLVVIGDRWQLARRAEPTDIVRHEIEKALSSDRNVIPLFIRGAVMPKADLLPVSLKPLVRRHGIPIRPDPDFDGDVLRLINAIQGNSTGNIHVEYAGGLGPWRREKERVHKLVGTWVGAGHQAYGPDKTEVNAKISLELALRGETVVGKGYFKGISARGISFDTVFELHGGFWHDRFLKLDYRNIDGAAVQFGAMMAHLSDTGSQFEGHYIGYGAVSRALIHGTFTLTRSV